MAAACTQTPCTMRFIRLFVLSIVCLGLVSCSVEIPAMAKTERGEIFIGHIRGTRDKATYSMRSIEGKLVQGTYSPREVGRTNLFNFGISDGRTGSVVVTRVGMTSGYGYGKLSTGEKVKVMYGQQSISMDMGVGF